MSTATPAARPYVAIVNGQVKTNSLKVAEHFGKQHKAVLRAIQNLDCSPEFHQRNFALMTIEIEIGKGAKRQSPAYEMTRDGFMFLAMGFTGKAAAQWKEAYIAAFNQLEDELAKRNTSALPHALRGPLPAKPAPIPSIYSSPLTGAPLTLGAMTARGAVDPALTLLNEMAAHHNDVAGALAWYQATRLHLSNFTGTLIMLRKVLRYGGAIVPADVEDALDFSGIDK